MADNPEKAEEKPEPGLLDRGKAAFAGLRERWPVLDHVVRMVEHMGIVQGTMLAGAVTYFGFLSFFPVLVIAFAVISYVAVVVPEAREQMIAAIESIFPGLIGDTPDAAIDIDTFAKSAGAVGLVALVGLLYSGLGWISALRAGLQGVFQVPKQEQRNFVVAKVVDLLALAIIGIVLVVSVALSSAVANLTEIILSALLLDEIPGMGTVVAAVGIALGVAASTMLFFTIFTLLPAAGLPRRAMVKGAFVAALGFEVLKLLASKLIALAASNPATAILGISLVLLVWINYFSRVVMFGAAWAYTSPEAKMQRDWEAAEEERKNQLEERRRLRRARYGPRRRAGAEQPSPARQRQIDRLSIAAGAAAGASVTAVASVVRRRH